jgi:hypothetical protein
VGVYSVASVLLATQVGRYLKGSMRDFTPVGDGSGQRIAPHLRSGVSAYSVDAGATPPVMAEHSMAEIQAGWPVAR